MFATNIQESALCATLADGLQPVNRFPTEKSMESTT
jgi:hypothetical protein